MFSVPVVKQSDFNNDMYQQSALIAHRALGNAFYFQVPSGTANPQQVCISLWFKLNDISQYQTIISTWFASSHQDIVGINNDGRLFWYNSIGSNTDSGSQWDHVFTDVGGWHHLQIICDSTQPDGTQREIAILDGVKLTKKTYPWGTTPQNREYNILKAASTWIGYSNNSQDYAKMEICDFNAFEGVGPDNSVFGTLWKKNDNIFVPKKPKLDVDTYGASGFRLNEGIALGWDESGNNNHWQAVAITPVGTPTKGRCFLSTIDKDSVLAVQSYGDEHNNRSNMNTTNAGFVRGCMGASSGVHYWEYEPLSQMNASDGFGITTLDTDEHNAAGRNRYDYSYWANGTLWNNNVGTVYGSAFTSSNRMGVKLDSDNNTVEFFKLGVSQGVKAITPNIYYPVLHFNGTATRGAVLFFSSVNWTQAPSGMTSANEMAIENRCVFNPNYLHQAKVDEYMNRLDARSMAGGTLNYDGETFTGQQKAIMSQLTMTTGKHRWEIWNTNIPSNAYASWSGVIRSDQYLTTWNTGSDMFRNPVAYACSYYGGASPKLTGYKGQVKQPNEFVITPSGNIGFYFDADAGELWAAPQGEAPKLMVDGIPSGTYKIGISDASVTSMNVQLITDPTTLGTIGITPPAGFEDYEPAGKALIHTSNQDSPSNNYCALNDTDKGMSMTINDGDTRMALGDAHNAVRGTQAIEGKKAFELYSCGSYANNPLIGVMYASGRISDQALSSGFYGFRSNGYTQVAGVDVAGQTSLWGGNAPDK